jgi:hypothetical protein
MMTEIEIVQDLFNTLGIHGSVHGPVSIADFVAGAHGLRDMGRDSSSDPRHIMQCIRRMREGIGSRYFQQLIDTPADVDDMWVHYWCPQPAGTDLAKAYCPAGTTPLWTNGTATVFTRLTKDKHGNDVFDFAVC